jgi:hypothetical protein
MANSIQQKNGSTTLKFNNSSLDLLVHFLLAFHISSIPLTKKEKYKSLFFNHYKKIKVILHF